MSKPIYKMTHGAIGEAMCCYTDGSYKDADIALTEYENSIRADERAKTIGEMTRRLNLKFVELPLDDLIVLDILKEIKEVAKQMKGEK